MARWLSWLEQTAHTRQVGGSSPLLAISLKGGRQFGRLFLYSPTHGHYSPMNTGNCIHRLSMAICVIAWLLLCPAIASAQSFGLGFGLGLPLMDYMTGETDREYRITPEPGYYPVLKTLENAYGSVHFNASLLLNLDLPVDIEIRFDMTRMRWRKSVITHVSCTPVDVIDGNYSDVATTYIPLKDVEESCLNRNTYEAERDISKDERSSLWFFHISGGARYNFLKTEDWRLYAGGHLGLTLATTIDSDIWFGGNIDAIVGFMYRLSDLVWIELDAKILFMITQVPQDSQTRINHETQTGGNIFTSLIQPDAYVDLQLSIRFDFSNL